MNRRKSIIAIIVSFLIIVTTSLSIVLAGGNFDTRDNTSHGDYSGTGGSNNGSVFRDGTNVKPRSGTRYVIRIQNDDGEYEDIGGAWCDFFYLNHFHAAYNHTNDKNDLDKGGTASEMLLAGTIGLNGTKSDTNGVGNSVWNGMYSLKGSGKIFSTYASSRADYVKKVGDEEQYRHVIAWYYKDGTVNVSNFGLNDNDIKILIDYLEIVAKNLQTENAKNTLTSNQDYKYSQNEYQEIRKAAQKAEEQIEEIRQGKRLIQIRAEIVFRARFNDQMKNGLYGTDVSVRIREKKSSNMYYPVTWRDALEIGGGKANTAMEKVAKSLYEKDDLFRNEEQYAEKASKWGEKYYYGWDYIYWNDSPYIPEGITVNYKDIDTNENIVESESVMPGAISKREFTGYKYIGVQEILPIEGEIENVASKEILSTEEAVEITFWYRKTSSVKVYYKTNTYEKQLIAESAQIYLDSGEKLPLYSSDLPKNKNVFSYAGSFDIISYQNGEVVKEENKKSSSIEVLGDGQNDYIITFYYDIHAQVSFHQVYVTSIDGVDQQIYLGQYGDGTRYKVEVNEPVTAPGIDGLECIGSTIDYSTINYLGQAIQSTSPNNTIKVNEDTIKVEDEFVEPRVAVIFYYRPFYTLTVRHLDANGNLMPGEQPIRLALTPESADTGNLDLNPRNISSKQFQNYVNWKHILDTQEIFSINPTGVDEVNVEYNGNNRFLDFYYINQKVTIRHIDEDGRTLALPEERNVPGTFGKKDTIIYPYKGYCLNGAELVSSPQVTVDFNASYGSSNQELVFVYGAKPMVTMDGTALNISLGVIPEDMNNQYVSQDTAKKYWVLDKKVKLEISYAKEDVAGQVTGHEVKINLPFDIYIGSEYKKADGSWIDISNMVSWREEVNGEYTIYSATLDNIYIPIWVNEGSYEIKASVKQKYKIEYLNEAGNSVSTDEENNDSATGSVTIVGQIYDFTITGIQGDNMWRKSLLDHKIEYKASDIAIGQGNDQQNKQWLYGIMKGSNIFFTVKTKGSDNTSIKVIPSFYYVADGTGTLQKVDLYSENQKLDGSETFVKKLTKSAIRETQQYQAERVKATKMGSVTYQNSIKNLYTSSIGNYGLARFLNPLPSLDYLNKELSVDMKNKLLVVKTEDDLLEEARHWYCEYSIPNDVKAKDSTGKELEMKNGSIIVYFTIVSEKTINNEQVEYLAYSLPSPDATNGISQWEVEREGAKSYDMPKINVGDPIKITDKPWFIEDGKYGAVATIIFGNRSTTQNFDSVGSH